MPRPKPIPISFMRDTFVDWPCLVNICVARMTCPPDILMGVARDQSIAFPCQCQNECVRKKLKDRGTSTAAAAMCHMCLFLLHPSAVVALVSRKWIDRSITHIDNATHASVGLRLHVKL